MEYLTFSPEKEDIGKRIDVYISSLLDELSRSQVQKLIEEKHISINNKSIKSNYKLRCNDIINVEIPDPQPLEIEAEDIPLDIIYEDKDIIVINKPQNMVVHPAPGHYSGTVVNALLFHCKNELSGINGVMRPGIVHRIDMNTSGVIVAAKNDMAHKSLALQLSCHSITRKYYCIVCGNIKDDEGTIDKPIGRNPKDRKKMAVVPDGRRAVTHYRVLERYGKYTFVEAQLETGRTHQIRVHMASISHPLLGDMVYGSDKQPYKLKGQVLHAKVLGFIHPSKREYMEFSSPLPDYFEKLIEKFRTGHF
ncbi:MAG: RluA family pseudouridine synthase [Clostridia bacterium]|jgi:23S rRNA pseudouridine1911/1915/1917 synthase|nr:RluA family pseudouridine synthase [Clostridia bacterium]